MTSTQRHECTHLEGDDVALRCPLVHQRLEDFWYLIHLDEQTAFSALYFVLRLNSRRDEPSVRYFSLRRTEVGKWGNQNRHTILYLGKKKSLTAAAR